MRNLLNKNIVLFAIMSVIAFSVCTAYAQTHSKFAPGIEDVTVSISDTEYTATVIVDDEKLLSDIVLIAASYDKSTGKIAAVNMSAYKKGETSGNSISAAANVSAAEDFKYFLLNTEGGTQKNYPPVAPGAFKASVLPNSLELSWNRANDDFDSLSKYIIRADGKQVDEIEADKTVYMIENLKADISHSFEVTAVDDVGNESAAAELSQVFPASNSPVSATFDLSEEPTVGDNVKYTEEELKIGTKSNSWTVVDKDMWYNSSGSGGDYEEKELGENVFRIVRGSEKYFVVIFGEETKKNDTVNVSFDMWGSYRWQNGTVIYKNISDDIIEKVESIDFNKWKDFSYTMKTDFDLSDYGYAGESGFVIVYKGSGNDYLWVRQLIVKNIGFAVGITADSTKSSYGTEILPCGIELTGEQGNAISGNVLRDGNYAVGYAYRDIGGLDAFYLTQIYDTNAGKSADVPKSYIAFKVDSDKFPKSPTASKGLYLITEYYDGTYGDITAKPFEISYTAKSWNWANSSGTNVNMTGDNTWKTHVMPLGDIYFGVTNAADYAAITYRIPNANNGYNKCGILIRRVMIADEGFYQKYIAQ